MTEAIRTEGLTVRFGSFTAVDGVDLNIPQGARHAIIGPNGAGKTSLVQALTGTVQATAGRVIIEGEDVTRLSQAARVHKGLARTFQISQLFSGLSVLDNVCLAILEREGKTGIFWRSAHADKRVIEEAREHIDFVQLSDHADHTVVSLPYGTRRLVEIAIALATRPKVLVLDEPAAGVPSVQSAKIFERIHALPREMTLLFVEHDMGLVFRFAERITVLVAGQVLTEGTPAQISADERVREVYLGRGGHRAA